MRIPKSLTKKNILVLFGGFFLINLLVIIASHFFIPYLGFFPYKEESLQYNLPFFLNNLANFDGEHYLLIAKQGYLTYDQAFFPLYPILIKFLSFIFLNNSLVLAIVLSNTTTLFGIFIFEKFRKNFTKIDTILPLVFFLLFPTSFFLNAVYTEGLFFFLFFASLFLFHKKKYALSFIFGILTALTKLMGIFLVIPYAFVFLYSVRKKEISVGQFLNIFAPIMGFILYAWYLWRTTGDPLFFFHSQTVFGAHRSTNIVLLPQVLYRYGKILKTPDFNFQYFVSISELTTFIFVFCLLLYQIIILWKQKESREKHTMLGLNLFSLINILLPTATGTLSSIPRYALMSFSLFFLLGTFKNKYMFIVLGIIFFLLHALLLGFFAQGYFIG